MKKKERKEFQDINSRTLNQGWDLAKLRVLGSYTDRRPWSWLWSWLQLLLLLWLDFFCFLRAAIWLTEISTSFQGVSLVADKPIHWRALGQLMCQDQAIVCDQSEGFGMGVENESLSTESAWPPVQEEQWRGQFSWGQEVSRQAITDTVGTKQKNVHFQFEPDTCAYKMDS